MVRSTQLSVPGILLGGRVQAAVATCRVNRYRFATTPSATQYAFNTLVPWHGCNPSTPVCYPTYLSRGMGSAPKTMLVIYSSHSPHSSWLNTAGGPIVMQRTPEMPRGAAPGCCSSRVTSAATPPPNEWPAVRADTTNMFVLCFNSRPG